MTNHVLVNGLCVTPGGIYTVARELVSEISAIRPEWRFTFVVSEGAAVADELRAVVFPKNVTTLWAPARTMNRAVRLTYENTTLSAWAKENGVTSALQLNGMIIPALDVPTFSHNGDPWPYRRDVWGKNPGSRFVAYLKRREHARAVRKADAVGWTSAYLRDMVCDYLGFAPKRSTVLYNGMPASYIERARTRAFTSWEERPMEILTVSTLVDYKRQSLVIEALAVLSKMPGFEQLRYRMIGSVLDNHDQELRRIAAKLGVSDRISIEGRLPQPEVEAAYASARVLAFMSICECFGLPPVEAMTYGTPSVVADCCSAREIYGDAVDYCTPDDVDELVAALRNALTDSHRAGELRELGAERAQMFSWTKTAEAMAGQLGELAAGGQGDSAKAPASTWAGDKSLDGA